MKLGNHPLYTRWSEADIARLRAAYAAPLNTQIGLDALAVELGRLKSNVSRKARELGLTDQQRPMIAAEDLKVRLPKFGTVEELRAAQSVNAKRRIAENGHPRGMLGKQHTPAMKQAAAVTSSARWAAMTKAERDDQVLSQAVGRRAKPPQPRARGSWKAGWREIGGQRAFFRSKWEANYAHYLEWLRSIGQIKSWEHEPHTFWFEGIKRGCVSYLPDFRVTNPGGSIEWHEVKGWMDARSHTTLKRMSKYHPAEKMVLIREKQYREIKAKVSSLIPGWEA